MPSASQTGALAPDDDELCVADRVHVREGVPEARVAHGPHRYASGPERAMVTAAQPRRAAARAVRGIPRERWRRSAEDGASARGPGGTSSRPRWPWPSRCPPPPSWPRAVSRPARSTAGCTAAGGRLRRRRVDAAARRRASAAGAVTGRPRAAPNVPLRARPGAGRGPPRRRARRWLRALRDGDVGRASGWLNLPTRFQTTAGSRCCRSPPTGWRPRLLAALRAAAPSAPAASALSSSRGCASRPGPAGAAAARPARGPAGDPGRARPHHRALPPPTDPRRLPSGPGPCGSSPPTARRRDGDACP